MVVVIKPEVVGVVGTFAKTKAKCAFVVEWTDKVAHLAPKQPLPLGNSQSQPTLYLSIFGPVISDPLALILFLYLVHGGFVVWWGVWVMTETGFDVRQKKELSFTEKCISSASFCLVQLLGWLLDK